LRPRENVSATDDDRKDRHGIPFTALEGKQRKGEARRETRRETKR
jgi:hypothetical protein